MLYEAVGLLLAEGFCAMHRMEEIGHIFHRVDPGRKPSRIEVEYVSYKGLFFGRNQLKLTVASLTHRDTSFDTVAESRFGYLVRLYSVSD